MIGSILTGIKYVRSMLYKIKSPILILAGSNDIYCPISETKMIQNKIGSFDRHVKILEGGHHELFTDKKREILYKKILGWVQERLPEGGKGKRTLWSKNLIFYQ